MFILESFLVELGFDGFDVEDFSFVVVDSDDGRDDLVEL